MPARLPSFPRSAPADDADKGLLKELGGLVQHLLIGVRAGLQEPDPDELHGNPPCCAFSKQQEREIRKPPAVDFQ